MFNSSDELSLAGSKVDTESIHSLLKFLLLSKLYLKKTKQKHFIEGRPKSEFKNLLKII